MGYPWCEAEECSPRIGSGVDCGGKPWRDTALGMDDIHPGKRRRQSTPFGSDGWLLPIRWLTPALRAFNTPWFAQKANSQSVRVRWTWRIRPPSRFFFLNPRLRDLEAKGARAMDDSTSFTFHPHPVLFAGARFTALAAERATHPQPAKDSENSHESPASTKSDQHPHRRCVDRLQPAPAWCEEGGKEQANQKRSTNLRQIIPESKWHGVRRGAGSRFLKLLQQGVLAWIKEHGHDVRVMLKSRAGCPCPVFKIPIELLSSEHDGSVSARNHIHTRLRRVRAIPGRRGVPD